MKMHYVLKFFCTLMIGFFASSCTPYQTTGFMGGYEDVQIGEGRHKITFIGNGYTTTNRVIQMTERRATEVCKGPFDVLERDVKAGGLIAKPSATFIVQCK